VDTEARARRAPQILDAARERFFAKGFHGASINEIAQAAGVRSTNLYQYFASKNDSIVARSRPIWKAISICCDRWTMRPSLVAFRAWLEARRKLTRLGFSDLLRQDFKTAICKGPGQITSRFTGVLPRQFA
jgi:AcrR family transcriptional regulator